MEKWVRVADKAVFQSTPPRGGATDAGDAAAVKM